MISLLKKEKKSPPKELQIHNVLDTDVLDTIYPFAWKEHVSHIESGENFVKTLLIVDYPQRVKGNWLSELKRAKGNITYVQFLEPTQAYTMSEHLNRSIKNLQAELLRIKDPLRRLQLENERKSAERLLTKITSQNSKFMLLHTYVMVQAQTMEELEDQCESILRIINGCRMTSHPAKYVAKDAFWTTIPLNQNLLSDFTSQMMDSETASSFFPFDDSEIINLSKTATILGTNKKTNSLVAVDFQNGRDTLNQNVVIIGTSGTGKSTFQMMSMLRRYVMGARIFLCDPDNEYSHIVRSMGGVVIDLSSSAKTIINPFQIHSTELVDTEGFSDPDSSPIVNDLLKQKIQRLKTFFKVIKPDLSQVELSILDKMLFQLYQDFGITEGVDVFSLKAGGFPILEDFYNLFTALGKDDPERYEKVKDFYFILDSYVHGSNTLFNGHTNVDLSSRLISFNLKPLQNEAEVREACYLNIFGFLWDEVTKNRNELVYVLIDEFHFLTKNPDSMRFFFQAYKRFRKYNAGAIASTQQIKDVLETEDNLGSAVIENSFTKVFFGLENLGVTDLVEKTGMTFSDEELVLLKGKKQGEALLIYGSNRVFFKVQLTPEELRLWNPERYLEQTDADPIIVPNYADQIHLSPIELEELNSLTL